jgi:hypothetical protein
MCDRALVVPGGLTAVVTSVEAFTIVRAAWLATR